MAADQDDIKYWFELARSTKVEAIKYLEETARQVIAITTLLEGIYFASISISGVKQMGNINNPWFIVFVIFSVLTLIAWFMALYFSMRVFIPETYKTQIPESDLHEQMEIIRNTFDKILLYKQKNLTRSIRLLWFSFIPVVINIIVFLVFLPSPPPS